MLHLISLCAIALACASTLILLIDVIRYPQKMAIMNVVWPLTGLYFGPVALWSYFRFGRNKGDHSADRPYWQKVWTGVTHCGAGCSLGDFLAEWTVFLLGLTFFGSKLATNYLFDFAFAYLLGIVFQYFSIAPMRNVSGWPAILAAVKADTISLVAYEAGMFAFMAWMQHAVQPKLEPNDVRYWFLMQVAMIIGFFTAFPANWLLIRKGWKEAM